jgi:hypothetical protein
VEKALYVEPHPIGQYVDAHLIGQETLTRNASNMSVKQMKIVHLQKLVFPMNVLIHVIELFVDLERNAKLRLIELFASVLLVLKAIL